MLFWNEHAGFSIEKEGLNVGAVNRGMAASRPASAETEEAGMIDIANVNRAGSESRSWILGVATETEVGIADGEQLGVDGTVRLVATDAAFTQGRVLEHDGLGLFAVALGAGFVQARHGESAGRFHDVLTVGIVALHAVHLPFQDGMMLGKMKLSLSVQVTLETGGRIFARIDDEIGADGAGGHVLAPRSVTRFAAVLAGHLGLGQMQAGVRTRGENARDGAVTIGAGFVADEGCAFNFRRLKNGRVIGGAGSEQQSGNSSRKSQRQRDQQGQPLYIVKALQGQMVGGVMRGLYSSGATEP
jgi:hypothetical protein